MSTAIFLLSVGIASVATFRGIWDFWRESSSTEDVIHFNDPVGKWALVVQPVTASAPGRVRFQGTTWPAWSLGESFREGDSVAIAKLDNITMVVERWNCSGT